MYGDLLKSTPIFHRARKPQYTMRQDYFHAAPSPENLSNNIKFPISTFGKTIKRYFIDKFSINWRIQPHLRNEIFYNDEQNFMCICNKCVAFYIHIYVFVCTIIEWQKEPILIFIRECSNFQACSQKNGYKLLATV